jgi:predicted DsbA family dithiol-disulfide isomerase
VSSQKVITVDIWSDFVCPWCWIAKHRFEGALNQFEHKSLVQVNYRAYRIAPQEKPAQFGPAIATKFPSPDKADQVMDSAKTQGKTEGLDFNFETALYGDTLQAHCLVKSLIDPVRREALIERIFVESFTHGKSIFTKESLKEIALYVGISETVIDDAWKNARLESEVVRDELNVMHFGSGVPIYIFNSEILVSGAHSAARFLETLQSFASDRLLVNQEQAPTCN